MQRTALEAIQLDSPHVLPVDTASFRDDGAATRNSPSSKFRHGRERRINLGPIFRAVEGIRWERYRVLSWLIHQRLFIGQDFAGRAIVHNAGVPAEGDS